MTGIYTILGFVSELRFSEDGQDYILSFTQKKSWSVGKREAYVMIAKNRTQIFLTPWKRPRKTKAPIDSKAIEIATGWRGYDTTNAFKLNLSKKASTLGPIGYLSRIEYTSDKWSRRGDRAGRFSLYRHDFKDYPQLLADNNQNPKILAIKRRSTLITDRGIIG